MPARISAFVVWALVAAAAVFWGLRFAARPQPVPAHAVPVGESVAVAGDLTRLLGKPLVSAAPAEDQPPPPPAIASRLKLVGVMAPKAGRPPGGGLAMIAIDGKPARPYAPGAAVEGELVLQSVGLRTAQIGPSAGPPVVTLEVPRLAAPATGTLPPPAAFGAAGAAPTFAPPPAAPAFVPPPQGGQAFVPPAAPVQPQPAAPLPGSVQSVVPVPPPAGAAQMLPRGLAPLPAPAAPIPVPPPRGPGPLNQ